MVKGASKTLEPPQGIGEIHIRTSRWARHASPGSIVLIAALLITAMFGVFGGQPHPKRRIDTPAAVIALQFPEILRNGQFFEMRAKVKAKRDFVDMRLGITTSYWHDLTINTMIPAAAEEISTNGEYQFGYGPVKAGEEITIKFDGQINPPLFAGNKGFLTLMDGETVVARTPIKLRVIP